MQGLGRGHGSCPGGPGAAGGWGQHGSGPVRWHPTVCVCVREEVEQICRFFVHKIDNFRVFIFCIQGECSSLIGWIIVKHLTECQTWCRSGSPNSFPVAVSNRCTTGGRQIKHVLLTHYLHQDKNHFTTHYTLRFHKVVMMNFIVHWWDQERIRTGD